MRILTFTTLYPNAAQPYHGVFVEQRLRQLVNCGAVEPLVIAPVPWFPSGNGIFGRYARYAAVPRTEIRHGIQILHPRYPVISKIGMSMAPFLLAGAALRTVRTTLDGGSKFDLIDAHYFYPDGVAAALIGRQVTKPVVITARGSDINLIARYAWPRRLIVWAARSASAVIAVSQALKDSLVGLGIPAEKVTVLRNGVDLGLFQPLDREAVRSRLGLTGLVLLSVGNLVKGKGHDTAIRAVARLREATLLVVGEGVEARALRSLADELGVSQRVRFIGGVQQAELATYYSAADVLLLPSMREGWPNVLLESMACGTPVVATNVGGVPEIVRTPEAGVLIEDRAPGTLVRGIETLLGRRPDRMATRRYAERFDWDSTTHGQLGLFRRSVSQGELA